MKVKYILLIVSLLLLSGEAFTQAGTLDPSFGTDGIVVYNSGTQVHDNSFDVHVYDDNSIIIVGSHMDFSYNSIGVIQKFLSDGSVDNTWGTNGVLEIQYGEDTFPYNITILEDGKILVAGSVYIAGGNSEMFAARFLANGTPDVSFNGTGVWIGQYASSEELGFAMTLQPDGKILLGGQEGSATMSNLLFARLNSNGTLDTSFGTNGYTSIDTNPQTETVKSLGILSTGEIIGIGYVHVSDPYFTELFMMAKLDVNGMPVSGFGNNGVFIPSEFNSTSFGRSCVIVNDNIIATGNFQSGSMFVTKLNSLGTLDPTFGNSGIAYLNINVVNSGNQLFFGGDNKYYVCGTSGDASPGPREFLLARFDINGNLDASFNGVGYVTTSIRTNWDDANALAMASDGKIILTGFSSGYDSSGDNDIALTRYLNDYVPPIFEPDFEASPTTICEGGQVDYTNLSQGTITSYTWTFEGGTPATSTEENPIVSYSSTGIYTTKLVISDGTQSDSLTRNDYIQVDAMPSQPDTPVGPDFMCQNEIVEYTTFPVTYANSYDWVVDPANAGNLTGTDTIAIFEPSTEYTGDYSIKVRAEGVCGNGVWSDELFATLNFAPAVYNLIGDGEYCEGTDGAELIMDGSQEGVDYELYIDDVTTGVIVAGTGNSFSFGMFTDEGIYSVIGYASVCTESMIGNVWVHQIYAPEQPETPIGPDVVCASDSTEYYINPISDIDDYTWYLAPNNAGIIIPDNNNVIIAWDNAFNGIAAITVSVINNCGDSPISDPLTITVNAMPAPVISGPNTVCDNTVASYEITEITGSSWIWEVTGGSIIAGAGTNMIDVSWSEPGTGQVIVTETNAEGCTGVSEPVIVTIDDCIGLDEVIANNLNIYPNPIKDILFINRSNTEVSGNICILNSLGVVVQKEQIPYGVSDISIKIEDSASGIYFLIYTESNKIISSKTLMIY